MLLVDDQVCDEQIEIVVASSKEGVTLVRDIAPHIGKLHLNDLDQEVRSIGENLVLQWRFYHVDCLRSTYNIGVWAWSRFYSASSAGPCLRNS